MTIAPLEFDADANNPLDILEELVVANEWPFDRSGPDEMVVEATGRWCDYRMFFVWRKDVQPCILPVRLIHGFRRTVEVKSQIYWP